ncbi:hypothetical protein ENBRE01_2071 [Enteropsectra breve]|nr:hypothetical protein ENBRE01_2071 [Enteropsectra breve]
MGGNEVIVEADESKFGKKKYHKGHKVEGVWIFGFVEKTLKRKLYLFQVKNRKKETLMPLMITYIDKNSIIRTDCWKGYADVSKHFKKHQTVNHSRHYKDPETGVHTNTIEGNWSPLKSAVPVRCRTKKLIDIYLLRKMVERNKEGDTLEYLLN